MDRWRLCSKVVEVFLCPSNPDPCKQLFKMSSCGFYLLCFPSPSPSPSSLGEEVEAQSSAKVWLKQAQQQEHETYP
jgi:hypothetical protein